MSQIYHQSVEDILKAATPEQRLLWNYVFLRWGERIAISQFHYYGAPGGVELATYSANKIYFAYQINISAYSTLGANAPQLILYNEANAAKFYLEKNVVMWDATAAAARFTAQSNTINNILFSRWAAITMPFAEFIGYRIAI